MEKITPPQHKTVLDACCGSRMFWFDKQHYNTIYADIREEKHLLKDRNLMRELVIAPDIVSDFTNMKFADNSFKLVIFDPPHMNKLGKSSWLARKYGTLLPSWEHDIKTGFDECMRVLEPCGILIFKWNEVQISAQKILSLIPYQPLVGHPTTTHGKTIWMCFMKTPNTDF